MKTKTVRVRTACLAAAALLVVNAFFIFCPGASESAVDTMGYSINGNQELMADPTRPIVYSADPNGDSITIFNASSGQEIWNITVGQGPMSMDISPDGGYMYVAVTGTSSISVVDLDARSVDKTISLTYSPISVRLGLSSRLYITGSGILDVVNENSGGRIEVIGGLGNCVLEMSPDKQTLLVLQLGSSPTPVYKYSCAGPSLALLGQDHGDLGSNAMQMAVDWANETLYLANGAPYGIQVISIATMNLTDTIPATAYPSGVALSPDHETVFLTTKGGPEELWAYSTSNWSLIAKYKFREIVDGADPTNNRSIAAPVGAGPVVAVGYPVHFMNISTPAIFPGFPIEKDWVVYLYDASITADIFVGVPPHQFTSNAMTLDGAAIPSSIVGHQLVGDPWPITRGGSHLVHASIAWDGGSVEVNWTFNTSEAEHIVWELPEDGSHLNYIPENVTIALDLGVPRRSLIGSNILLNGVDASWHLDNETLIIDTSQGVVPGVNRVSAELDFWHIDYVQVEYSTLYEYLEFNITDVPVTPSNQGLDWHNLSGKASMMLPADWTVEDDVTVGSTVFDTQALGPIRSKARQSISLQTGIDPNTTGDPQYLDNYPGELLEQLRSLGYRAYTVEGPRSVEVSGLPGIVFAIRWENQSIAQKFMVVTNQQTGEFWVLIMTTDALTYYEDNPMFEGVISSFSMPDDKTDDDMSTVADAVMVALYAVVGAVAALAVAMLLVMLGLWPSRRPPVK